MKLRLWMLFSALALAIAPAKSQTLVPADVKPPLVPGPSAIIARDVLVASGDTLSSIAKRELGRTGLAPLLADFNGLVLEAPLIPGNIIRVPIHVPARGEYAEVVFAKGEVFVLRASPEPAASASVATLVTNSSPLSIPVQRSFEIIVGDIISTGSDGYVSIEFSTGSVINLQPETEAALRKLNCLPRDASCVIEIRTERGKLTSDINIRDGQPVDFRINTPYASAAVRGTVFDIDAAAGKLLVGVTDGDVDVSAASTTVAVAAGFGSVVNEGQAPSEPIALLPSPVFRRVPARMAPGDLLSWWPLADANGYDAQITNDEQGKEALATYSVTEANLGFDNLASGDYFLQLRAVDVNSLKGFLSNTRLTIADIDPSIPVVETSITRQGQEYLVTILAPPAEAAGFEIQISTEATFEDPLSVDVNSTGTAVFRVDNNQVFTRARALVDPYTVSAFGPIANSEQ